MFLEDHPIATLGAILGKKASEASKTLKNGNLKNYEKLAAQFEQTQRTLFQVVKSELKNKNGGQEEETF